MSRHLKWSILYLLLMALGFIMDAIGFAGGIELPDMFNNWQTDFLISFTGVGLIIFSIVKLTKHFPKINSNSP